MDFRNKLVLLVMFLVISLVALVVIFEKYNPDTYIGSEGVKLQEVTPKTYIFPDSSDPRNFAPQIYGYQWGEPSITYCQKSSEDGQMMLCSVAEKKYNGYHD